MDAPKQPAATGLEEDTTALPADAEAGAPPEAAAQLDEQALEGFLEQMRGEQNLPVGVVAGLIAAIIAAGAWAGVTLLANMQIGFMAIGVGALVGLTVRLAGKGMHLGFGIAGALLAAVGCFAGNLLTVYLELATLISAGEINGPLDVELLMAGVIGFFSPIDLLFYGLAIYFGYQFSFRRVSEEQLAQFVKPA